MTGSVVEAWTSATMSGEAAIVVMNHEAATAWINPPKFETSVASQMARKIDCRKGTNGDVDAPSAETSDRSSGPAGSSRGWVSRSTGMYQGLRDTPPFANHETVPPPVAL